MNAVSIPQLWAPLEKEERSLRDQLFRGPEYWKSDLTPLQRLHAQIAQQMTESFQKEGWPTIPVVGWDEAIAAARLATRCISQPRFMRECLPWIEQAYRFGGVPNDWFAEFYDTVMYFENKPQIFGTFLDWTTSLEVGPWVIFEPSKIDDRRKLFSLRLHAEDYAIRVSQWNERSPVPPHDYRSYFESLEAWATSVGWVRKLERLSFE